MGDICIGLAFRDYWWREQQFHYPGSHTEWGGLCHLFDNLAKRKQRTRAGDWMVWSFGFMQRLNLQRCFFEYISTDSLLLLLAGMNHVYKQAVYILML